MHNLVGNLSLALANPVLLVVVCSYLIGGCGGNAGQGVSVDASTGFPMNAVLPTGLRLLAGTSSEFLPEQIGAEFASDLLYSRCTVVGESAVFTPDWPESTNSQASDAAFAIYALELDRTAPSAELTLTWDGAVPSAQCWIGLPNWAEQRWQWGMLTPTGIMTIGNPSSFADGNDHTFVAVVLLGNTQAQLDLISIAGLDPELTYPIVDTNQSTAYDDHGQVINPLPGEAFYGQDSQYNGTAPQYTDNGDGTITDDVTGLMWAKSPNGQTKLTFDDCFNYAAGLSLGGYDDWRVPSIKELYSLMDFTGVTGMSAGTSTPYLDTAYFDFEYGDEPAERFIDAQYWSSTEYVSTTMSGDATVFGVNFADGRIKGYPKFKPPPMGGGDNVMFMRVVRGNPDYGVNNFVDNGDGTITDSATGLTWMQADSGVGMNWQDALAYAENLDYSGQSDWRMPNAKELQSILDYTRSPDTTGSAAIDPLFQCSGILDEAGFADYPFFWTNTSHLDGIDPGQRAAYLCFGEALGFMEQPPGSGNYQLLDVHGAGSQRSDLKDGDPDDYPNGHGPQGDVIRIFNYVRCVRGGG